MNKLLSTEGKYGEKIYGRNQTIELLFTIPIKYVQSVCMYTVYVESRYTHKETGDPARLPAQLARRWGQMK